jgi:hypothetical protein
MASDALRLLDDATTWRAWCRAKDSPQWSYEDTARFALRVARRIYQGTTEAAHVTASLPDLMALMSEQVLPAIINEQQDRGESRAWVNGHPVLYLFVYALRGLTAQPAVAAPAAGLLQKVVDIANGNRGTY